MIHTSHNQQFIAERLEGFQHTLKTFLLQRGWNSETKKHIKRSRRHGRIFSRKC